MWTLFGRSSSAKPSAFGEFAGAAYSELIEAHIRHEDSRKESIERRALSVVTTSGLIVSVAVAVGQVASGSLATLPAEGLGFVVYGVLALITAVVCAIVANAPIYYDVAESDALRRLTEPEFWGAPRTLGARRVAEVRVDELIKARSSNAKKAWWLRVALLMEALGIACFGLAAFVIFVFFATR